MASFFKPSIQCIIDSVQEQRKKAHKKFTVSINYFLFINAGRLFDIVDWQHVVLVGGFAASDWLYKKVSEALKEKGFSVVRPDHHV